MPQSMQRKVLLYLLNQFHISCCRCFFLSMTLSLCLSYQFLLYSFWCSARVSLSLYGISFSHVSLNRRKNFSPVFEIVRFSPMADSMAVATEYFALTDLLFQLFEGDIPSSSNDLADSKALLFPISMMELKASRMIFATLCTAKFALVTPEPYP